MEAALLSKQFFYERYVAFSDTDAMGVVHHANYLRFCEEARVAWMRATNLTKIHYPVSENVLAVLHHQVWHLKPARFEDLVRVELQVRSQRLKIQFQYVMFIGTERIAEAETLHIPLNKNLRPVRHAPELLNQMEKESWTETWLSNS